MIKHFREAFLSILSDEKSRSNVDGKLKRWNKELNATEGFLTDNEIPTSVITCRTPDIDYYNDSDNMTPPNGLLWLTNKRLLFVYKTGGGLFKTPDFHFLEYDFSSLASIKHVLKGTIFKTSWIFLYISTMSANGRVIDVSFEVSASYSKESAKSFINNVQQHQNSLSNKSTHANKSNKSDKAGKSLLDKLEQLDKFRQEGVLSEEEFQTAKTRLLNM